MIFSGYIDSYRNLIGNLYPFNKISSTFFHICTHEILVVVTANWQIGKDQKCSNKCQCPLAKPSQEKRPQKHQSIAKTLEDSTIFSSSTSITDPCRIITFFTRNPDTASTVHSSTSMSATRSTSRCP
jgi:hypothetical protein